MPTRMRMRWLALPAAAAGLIVLCGGCKRNGGMAGCVAIERIAFGSSSRQSNSQRFWQSIAANEPGLWIWTGDCVYATPGDAADLQRAFDTQRNNPDYRAFARHTHILGVWDTFDYGQRPGRSDNPIRATAQKLYLDFLGEPQLSRRRSGKGIHTSQTFGPPGRRIKIILLDTRSFNTGPDSPQRHPLLGSEQWAWLETELAATDAQFIFLVSSIPFLPLELPLEKWFDYKDERADLLRLIGNTQAFGVVILSGGRQLGEMSATRPLATQYTIHEITSSGLTTFDREYSGDHNRYRVGDVFIGQHFGLITIDWAVDPPKIRFEIRDEKNRPGLVLEAEREDLEPPGGVRKRRKPTNTELGAD